GEATALVNGVVKVYEKEVVQAETEKRQKQLNEVDGKFRDLHEQLHKKREKLRNLAAELGGSPDSGALSQLQVNRLARLGEKERQHGMARTERMMAQVRLDAHKAQPPKPREAPDLDAAVDVEFESDPDVKLQRKELEKYQEGLAELERRRPNEEDSVKKAARQHVSRLQTKLDEKKTKLRISIDQRFKSIIKAEFE